MLRSGACPPEKRYRWLLAIGILILGVCAQLLIDNGQHVSGVIVFSVAAAASAIWLPFPPLQLRSGSFDGVVRGTPWVVPAVLLASLAFVFFDANRFTVTNSIPWLLAIACLLVPVVRELFVTSQRRESPHFYWMLGLMLATALGAFFRFYRLSALPAEMGCDVPHVYSNVAQILSGDLAVFFPSHPGREGLFFYLTAPIAAILGQSFYAIKVSSALIGTLSIPLTYWVGRLLWNRRAGLSSAFLMAISHWHILMSRTGLRAITLPLIWLACWGALIKAWHGGSRAWYIVGGLCLGLGFYTYNAFMVAPFVLLVWLVLELARGNGQRLRRHAPGILLVVVTAIVILVPLLGYIAQDPERYIYRAATRVTSTERDLPDSAIVLLGRNALNALLMFNVEGDAVHVANVPYLRELGLVAAALFAIGVVHLLRFWRVGQNAWVLIAGLGMLGPSMLALAFPNEVPNAIRAIGACPAAVLVAGYALDLLLYHGLPSSGTFCGTGRVVLCVALLAGLGGHEVADAWKTCFIDYPAALPFRNYSISLDMATTIVDNEGLGTVVIWPYWYDGNAVACQLDSMGHDTFHEVTDLELDYPWVPGALFILNPQDEHSLEILSKYGEIRTIEHLDYEGHVAFIAAYGDS